MPNRTKVEKMISKFGGKLTTLLAGLLAAALIIYSGYVLYDTFYIQKNAGNSWELVELKAQVMEDIDDGTSPTAGSLAEINKDFRAWLTIYDTNIDYPVMQTTNNDYYLYHMFNGEENGAGSIFVDYRNEKPFQDFNTIIYGHRMKDGSMFRSLVDYRDADFYNAHKTMLLTTPDAKYDVHVFSVVTVPATSDLYQLEFADDAEKQAYIDRVISESETKMDVSVSASDRIVMMSTCTFEIDDGRLCVYGKLVERAGE